MNRVRLATPADIPALFAVRTSVRENHLDIAQLAERGVTPESMAALLAGGQSETWVAESEQGIIGFSTADARTGSISALFVSPGAERQGYGRVLQAAEEWLFGAGWETIGLQTGEEADNRAHAFYRAAGWIMAGPADHDDVRYEKSRPSTL
ncbi:MAG TPA: GNAT family N-acetyltransferase [Thermoanaerobaculia bacterium]|nr:GNAT family N-acetyltransferase [Thermoanaerobaculia bacterium]